MNGKLYIKSLKGLRLLVGKPLGEMTERDLRLLIETTMQELWLDLYSLELFQDENPEDFQRDRRPRSRDGSDPQGDFQAFIEYVRNESPTYKEFLEGYTMQEAKSMIRELHQDLQEPSDEELRKEYHDGFNNRDAEINKLNEEYFELANSLSTPSPRLTWEAAQHWDRERYFREKARFYELIKNYHRQIAWGWMGLKPAWILLHYARFYFGGRYMWTDEYGWQEIATGRRTRLVKRDDSPYGSDTPKCPQWMNDAANDLFHIGNHLIKGSVVMPGQLNSAVDWEPTPEYLQWRQEHQKKLELFWKFPILWAWFDVDTIDPFWFSADNELVRHWVAGLELRRQRRYGTEWYLHPMLVKPFENPDIGRVTPCTLNYAKS